MEGIDGIFYWNFIKDYEYSNKDNNVIIFGSEDNFILKKDSILYYLNVYEFGGSYESDDLLTFTGSDDNIIINISDMSFKSHRIR